MIAIIALRRIRKTRANLLILSQTTNPSRIIYRRRHRRQSPDCGSPSSTTATTLTPASVLLRLPLLLNQRWVIESVRCLLPLPLPCCLLRVTLCPPSALRQLVASAPCPNSIPLHNIHAITAPSYTHTSPGPSQVDLAWSQQLTKEASEISSPHVVPPSDDGSKPRERNLPLLSQ